VKPPSGGFLLLIERVNGRFHEYGGTLERQGDALARAATLKKIPIYSDVRSLRSSHAISGVGAERASTRTPGINGQKVNRK
jgi:hypothetical protein